MNQSNWEVKEFILVSIGEVPVFNLSSTTAFTNSNYLLERLAMFSLLEIALGSRINAFEAPKVLGDQYLLAIALNGEA